MSCRRPNSVAPSGWSCRLLAGGRGVHIANPILLDADAIIGVDVCTLDPRGGTRNSRPIRRCLCRLRKPRTGLRALSGWLTRSGRGMSPGGRSLKKNSVVTASQRKQVNANTKGLIHVSLFRFVQYRSDLALTVAIPFGARAQEAPDPHHAAGTVSSTTPPANSGASSSQTPASPGAPTPGMAGMMPMPMIGLQGMACRGAMPGISAMGMPGWLFQESLCREWGLQCRR